MSKKKKRFIHYTVLKEIEHCDLDLELQDFVFGANPDGHDYDGTIKDLSKKGNYWWNGENDYLEIDKAIKTLQRLKKAGATHVDITPHCDHHGYNFYGSIFREATEEEIKKEEDAKYQAKVLVAKTELERMESAIVEYKETLEDYERKQAEKRRKGDN